MDKPDESHSTESAPSADGRSLMIAATGVNVQIKTEVVAIKQEPNIKLEPDEVDTIEYTPRTHQLNEIFIPKVEKIELNDDEDEVNVVRASYGQSDRFHESKSTSMTNTKPKDTDTLPQNGIQACGMYVATGHRSRNNGSNMNDAVASTSKRASKYAMKVGKQKRKQHKCTQCDYSTPYLWNLNKHMGKHSGEKPFPCIHCPKRFTEKRNLQQHLKVHVTKDLLNCSICWKIFGTEHDKFHHESKCNRKRRYECHLCQKFTTSNIHQLKIHMRVHSGERPFMCAQCSTAFSLKYNLKKHMEIHAKPHLSKFRCSVCAQNFLKQSEKDARELNCKRRRYECYLCQRYMTHLKSSLQYHLRMQHTGERPFKCNWCERRYAMVWMLTIHKKRTHKQ